MSKFTKSQIIKMIKEKEITEELKEFCKKNIIDLSNCDLSNCLIDINLDGANLDGANLNRANLNRANLYRANLNEANLYRANLNEANLNRASLNRANLDGANLDGANLNGASLNGAILDGAVNNPICIDNCMKSEILLKEGFIIEGLYVIGFRTKYPQFNGDRQTPYEVGKTYKADFFNQNYQDECSFGLYICGGTRYLENNYKNPTSLDAYKFIKVKADICSILKAGDKFRVPEFEVLQEYKDLDEIKSELLGAEYGNK